MFVFFQAYKAHTVKVPRWLLIICFYNKKYRRNAKYFVVYHPYVLKKCSTSLFLHFSSFVSYFMKFEYALLSYIIYNASYVTAAYITFNVSSEAH